MSSTEIFAITKKRNLVLVGSIKQSQLGCIWIWNKLLKRYFPDKKPNLENYNLVWGLAKTNNLDSFEYDVLDSTFDNYICKKENSLKLAESLELFNEKYSENNNLNPNLKEQAEIFKKISKFNKYIGFVFNQTSINESLWKDKEHLNFLINKIQ